MRQQVPIRYVLFLALLLAACDTRVPPPDPTPSPSPIPPRPTATATTTATALKATPTISTPAELPRDFEYDPEAPLNIDIGSESEADGIQIINLSYASLMGDTVPATLVIPTGEGPFPAVLYLHCGHSASCTKSQFSFEMIELAGEGIASLAINGPLLRMSKANFDPEPMFIYTVLDIRRGIDLLSSLPEIDPDRVGFVGHSYGATTGGILAGVEARIRAFVLMAGHAQISELDGPASIAYLDAVNYIGQASPAAVYFQFAEEDLFISREAAEFFYQAASEPKTISWYPTGHDFNSAAMYDRIAWLAEQLSAAD
jgi:dienelactone hydrolase